MVADYTFDSPSSYTDYDLAEYLTTIESEILLRFTDTAHPTDMLWKLAKDDASYLSSNRNVRRFLRVVEFEINAEPSGLADLKTILQRHDFNIVAIYPATNVFGDGQSAEVFQVTMGEEEVGYAEASMALIVTGSQPGQYKAYSLNTDWSSLAWYDRQIIHVADLNGNHQPDIQLFNTWYGIGFGAGWCGSSASIYEWKGPFPGGRFVSLPSNIEDTAITNDGECSDDFWEFGPQNDDGTQLVISTEKFYVGATDYARVDCSNFELRKSYIWADSALVLAEKTISAPNLSDPSWCAVLWADRAGMNDDSMPTLMAALENWPAAAMDTIWGPAAQDYFRFKLGTWYALRGETELAVNTLKLVSEHPTNPQFTMASRIAVIYLASYQSKQNFIGACQAAYKILDAAWPDIPPGASGSEQQFFREAWGFSAPYWGYGPNNVCDSREFFPLSIQSFQSHNTTELYAWFREQQIPVWTIAQGDLNDDGLEDLVALAKTSEYGQWDLWALLQTETGLNAVLVESLYYPQASYFATLTQTQTENGLFHVFNLGAKATAFRLAMKDGVWQAVDVKTTTPPAPSRGPTQSERIAQVEEMLFEKGDIAGAKIELQRLLAGRINEDNYYGDSLPHVRPRLLYLLGLTYELLGDEANAVQTYWQLWHDYADNPYTFIARRKLEAKP